MDGLIPFAGSTALVRCGNEEYSSLTQGAAMEPGRITSPSASWATNAATDSVFTDIIGAMTSTSNSSITTISREPNIEHAWGTLDSLFDTPLTGNMQSALAQPSANRTLLLPNTAINNELSPVTFEQYPFKMAEAVFSHTFPALDLSVNSDGWLKKGKYNQDFGSAINRVVAKHPLYNDVPKPPLWLCKPAASSAGAMYSADWLNGCTMRAPGVINIMFVGETHKNEADILRAEKIIESASQIPGGDPFFTLAVMERGLPYNASDSASAVLREADLTQLIPPYDGVNPEFLSKVEHSELDNLNSVNFGLLMSKVQRSNVLGAAMCYWLASRDPTINERIVVFIGERHIADLESKDGFLRTYFSHLNPLRRRIVHVTVLGSLAAS